MAWLPVRSQTKLLRAKGANVIFLPISEYNPGFLCPWPDGLLCPLSLNCCILLLVEENPVQYKEDILFKLLHHALHKFINMYPVVIHTPWSEKEDSCQRNEEHLSCGHNFCLSHSNRPLSSSSSLLVAEGWHTPSATSVGHPGGSLHQCEWWFSDQLELCAWDWDEGLLLANQGGWSC